MSMIQILIMDSVKQQGLITLADNYQPSLDKLTKPSSSVVVEKSLSRSKSLSDLSVGSNNSTKVLSFASPRTSEVSTVCELSNITISDVSIPRFYNEANVEKIKAATARVNKAEADIKKSYDDFLKEIALIEQRKKSELQQAKNKAANTQALALRSAVGLALIASPEAEHRKKEAIKVSEAKADRDAKIAFFNFRKNTSEHQKTIAGSILEKRTLRAERQVEEINQFFTESLPIFDEQSSHIEATALALIDNPATASSQELSFVQQVMTATDYLRCIALVDGADDDISDASVELERVDQSLASLSDSDLPAGSRFSSQAIITKTQEALTKYRADFLLAQTESDKTAGLVAKNITSDLFQQVNALRAKAASSTKESLRATEDDRAKLEEQATTLKEFATLLESAALAYDQIADACSVEIRSIAEMKKNFLTLRSEIARSATTDKSQTDIVNALDSAGISAFDSRPDAGNIFDLNIFSQLDEIGGSYKEYAISGSKGKIVLTSPPSERLSEPNRKNYNNGINLIKLAIFRDFGVYGVKRFEDRFEAKITARNPLHLDELREFISSETATHPRSCFISSRQPLEEVISAEGAANDTRVIKSDGYEPSFNPFSNTSVSESVITNETEATKQGIGATRKALREFLKKGGATDSKIDVIINDFNQKFTDKGDNAPLTIAALRSFIKEHDDVGLFSNLLLAHNRNRLGFALFTAFMSAIRTTPLLLHAGLLAAFVMVLGTQAINDWTAGSRQAPRDDD